MQTAKDELLAYIQKQIREKLNNDADYVAAQAGCQSFEEYRFMCGEIQGLAIAESILLEADEMQHRGDNEDKKH